ncbi:MAG: hypothetical protein VXZ24_12815 [Pseudomonadota bacterium]|jgi:hypothetical protein|nr:hypothetical protein [Pseudomonadota bacterium]MEC8525109.1 hypothetical protein [Pseudomonadota bacterium]
MSDITTPDYLKDAEQLLSDSGFATSDDWYHGTSSGLVSTILKDGLKGGGDSETAAREQGTLGTIGNRQFESSEPVFLTQSKELAYFWAARKAHTRNLYFRKEEEAVVLKISSPAKVTPDVGGTAILLEPSNTYIAMLKEVYEKKGIDWIDESNPLKLPREIYLEKLGLGYSYDDIPAEKISVVSEDAS